MLHYCKQQILFVLNALLNRIVMPSVI